MTTNQHFKTQAEIQWYLLEEEGRRVRNTESGLIAGYLDGALWDFASDMLWSVPMEPRYWRPHEPKPWHEGVEPGTVLCWFWTERESEKIVDAFSYFDGDDDLKYAATATGLWEYCRPLTPEEVAKLHEAAVRVQEK